MKKVSRICLALLLLMSVSIVTASPKTVLHIQHWQTANGAKVYFVRAPELPMLDIRVAFKAGSAYDGSHLGVANFVNQMFQQGTTTRSANQIATALDTVGAIMDDGLDRDVAQVTLRTLTDKHYLNKALAVFSDALTHSTFPEQAEARVQRQIMASIKVEQQNPFEVAKKLFFKNLYANTAYAHAPEGNLQSVAALTRQQLLDFYRRFYVAKNAYVILVGDITRRQAQQIAKQITAKLPTGVPAPKLNKAVSLKDGKHIHVDFPTKQTSIMIGQVGITRNNPNYFPLLVGNAVLGGLQSTSILYKQVRDERGLAYFAFSQFSAKPFRGPFVISLQTKANQANTTLNIVKTIVKDFLKNGPNQQQLTIAKKNMIGRFPLSLSTNKQIADVVTSLAVYGRPLDFLDHYRQHVSQVTLAQIKQAFNKTLQPKDMLVVLVGPKTGF